MPHVALPARLSAVPEARHWVADACREALPPAERQVVELLTSELVANAVLHGRPRSAPEDEVADHEPGHGTGDAARGVVEVHVHVAPGLVRVVVRDDNPDPPLLRHVGAEATGGRGVALVDALSTRWGHELLPTPRTGKSVWFELVAASAVAPGPVSGARPCSAAGPAGSARGR